MESTVPTQAQGFPVLRVFGVGDAGLNVIELMTQDGLRPELFVAVNTGGNGLANSPAARKLCLENRRLRGLGSGGDPERGRQAAEEKTEEFKALCEGVDVVFIVCGLGGGAGTGISPVLARVAKGAGALVLAFVASPFECEGPHRLYVAENGMEELRENADGLICLPNEKILELIGTNTSVVDTFRISNRFLADGVLGIWRLLSSKGLIQIHPDDLIRLLHDRHFECSFAVAQAAGPERATQVTDKLLAHPMIENGQGLGNADSVLVSLAGGPDLTMAEVNGIMEQIKARCESVRILMGAVIDEGFGDRLAVMVVTARKVELDAVRRTPETLDTQLLERASTMKPGSRFLPPPPVLGPEQVQQILAKQAARRAGRRRNGLKMRQAQLALEIVSKGRFDKSEPTIHKGEDLDVPTYIRRGVPLN